VPDSLKSVDNVDMQGLEGASNSCPKPACGLYRGAAGVPTGSEDALARLRRFASRTVLGCLTLAALPLAAHPLSLQECFEGGDFIAHAAQARDNGMTKAAFNDKLLADFYLIQAFPPELRWFVQDPEDAEFLLFEATTVFDEPRPPEAHRTEFLSRCFDRKLGAGPSIPSEPGPTPGLWPAEPDSRQW
jgi:hypothetical protein